MWDDEGHVTQVALRDVAGIAEGMAVLSPPAYVIATQLDGQTSLRDIQARIARDNDGMMVDSAVIGRLVDELDRIGFIDSPRFQELKANAVAAYRSSPTRLASCAGGAYPDDPDELRHFLDAFFHDPALKESKPTGSGTSSTTELRGLVAPHIDYRRGGACYAQAYGALRERCSADLFVVFGTAHARPDHLFTLTAKSYDTPLGAVPTDAAVVSSLAADLGEEEVFSDELAHRSEHSVELQMVWLRHIFRDRAFTAVPVLCSAIDELDQPERDERVVAFKKALAKAVAGRRVCYIAGADLSHVGVMYGDERGATPAELESFKTDDLKTVEQFCSGTPHSFAMDARRELESRRICGGAPMFATRPDAGRCQGRVLGYGQWTDGTDSVSFCAAGLF